MMKLDPRCVFILMLMAGIGLASLPTAFYFAALLLTIITAILQKRSTLYKYLIYGVITYSLHLLLIYSESSIAFKFFGMLSFFLYRFTIILILVDLMRSYSTGHLVAALIKLRIPLKVIIPLAIALRYFPDFTESMANIRDSMKIRKFKVGFLHPYRSFRYLSIPLIYKALNTASDIAESITTKGIEYQGQRSCYHEVSFKVQDLLVLFAFLSILVGALCWN
ncbi:energy-coupling factor transporter transmembrane component T [Acinetobacter rudis]|uniref:energy-coupling factor transporter transmembrane component T family protein n=1 Tax=Acinetobacter rudis TaxID=632955 RepID=UPI00280E8DBF|nr:energy-coupling factor transporter transmembrane component T [Acinetobacter rudis]MDQ8951757.1 energy-coupling factor transporter transmembrane component T [Acinetobacter rudis]